MREILPSAIGAIQGIDKPLRAEMEAHYVSPTLLGQLEQRKLQLEKMLVDVNNAIDGLKKNPEIESLLNLLQRVR